MILRKRKPLSFTKKWILWKIKWIDDDGISGINVETSYSILKKFAYQSQYFCCPWRNIKYVTNLDNFFKPYYRRWKDSVSLDGGKMSILRIWWAKPSYKGGKDTYFNVPIDPLREYPDSFIIATFWVTRTTKWFSPSYSSFLETQNLILRLPAITFLIIHESLRSSASIKDAKRHDSTDKILLASILI